MQCLGVRGGGSYITTGCRICLPYRNPKHRAQKQHLSNNIACLLVCVFKVSIVSTFIFSVHQRQASGLLLVGLDPYFPWEDVALGTN